jgi:hypothetical protein
MAPGLNVQSCRLLRQPRHAACCVCPILSSAPSVHACRLLHQSSHVVCCTCPVMSSAAPVRLCLQLHHYRRAISFQSRYAACCIFLSMPYAPSVPAYRLLHKSRYATCCTRPVVPSASLVQACCLLHQSRHGSLSTLSTLPQYHSCCSPQVGARTPPLLLLPHSVAGRLQCCSFSAGFLVVV